MRLPAMYFFLCGHCFSLSQSGISETSSRLRMRVRSVLAINQIQYLPALTIRLFPGLPITKSGFANSALSGLNCPKKGFNLHTNRMNQTKTAHAQTPADLGFAMPAEWEPHEATWLAWPHNP